MEPSSIVQHHDFSICSCNNFLSNRKFSTMSKRAQERRTEEELVVSKSRPGMFGIKSWIGVLCSRELRDWCGTVSKTQPFKVDFRIHGIPQDAVLEDQARTTEIQEQVDKLLCEHQTESVVADLSEKSKFNRFSEESKRTILRL